MITTLAAQVTKVLQVVIFMGSHPAGHACRAPPQRPRDWSWEINDDDDGGLARKRDTFSFLSGSDRAIKKPDVGVVVLVEG